MPFYKREAIELVTAQSVTGPGFALGEETHTENTYPVEGWYWFDDLDAAIKFFSTNESGSVTMRQARLALLAAGMLGSISAAIKSLPSPQKEVAEIEWEYSQEVHRHNGFVSLIGPFIGLTEKQIDQLFSVAATL